MQINWIYPQGGVRAPKESDIEKRLLAIFCPPARKESEGIYQSAETAEQYQKNPLIVQGVVLSRREFQ